MKRFVALILALIMVLSMATVAFASEVIEEEEETEEECKKCCCCCKPCYIKPCCIKPVCIKPCFMPRCHTYKIRNTGCCPMYFYVKPTCGLSLHGYHCHGVRPVCQNGWYCVKPGDTCEFTVKTGMCASKCGFNLCFAGNYQYTCSVA